MTNELTGLWENNDGERKGQRPPAAPWNEDETLAVAGQLKRLFAAQDRKLTGETHAMFLADLQATGLPPKAILLGIESLRLRDLPSIKIALIISAARATIEPSAESSAPAARCEECFSGVIEMFDDSNRGHAFACSCAAGDGKARSGLARWKGEAVQSSRGKTFYRTRRNQP